MATLALGAIGGAFLGPFGPALGAAIGSVIDSAYIFPALMNKEGPQNFGDVNIQAADEGTSIWRCLGPHNRVPGVVLYTGPAFSVTRSGGSGKRQEPASITWYADLAAGSVANDINRFVRIRADGREIYDARPEPSVDLEIGGTSGNCMISHSRLYVREPRPYVDNYYKLKIWNISVETRPVAVQYGSGFGIQILSMYNIITTGAGNDDAWTALVLSRAHGYSAGRRFYCTIFGLPGHNPDWGYEYWYAKAIDSTTIAINIQTLTFGSISNGSVAYLQSEMPYSAQASADTAAFMSFDLGRPVTVYNTTQGYYYFSTLHGAPENTNQTSPVVVARERLANDRFRLTLDINHIWAFGQVGNIPYQGAWPPPVAPGFIEASGYPTRRSGEGWLFIPREGDEIIIGQERENRLSTITDSYELSYETYGADEQRPSTIISNSLGSVDTPAFRPVSTFVAESFNLSSYGNRIPNFEFFCEEAETRTVAEAITSICAEYGITATTSDVSGNLSGMAWNGLATGVEVLQPLMLAYDIVAQETETGVRFFRRDQSTEVAIDTSVLASTSGDGIVPRVKFSRSSADRKPRSVRVRFFDLENDLVIGEVLENVTGVTEGDDVQLTFPISLTTAQARNIARRILRQGQLDMVATFTLPPPYAYLLENDVVTFTLNSRDYRIRLTTVDVGLDFRVDCRGVVEPAYALDSDGDLDDLTDLLSRSGGGEDYRPPPLAVEVVSGISLDVAHARTRGYYVFASPFDARSRFVGATVYTSVDGGTTWRDRGEVPAATIAYVIGSEIAAITDGDGDVLDSTSIVGVTPIGESVYEAVAAPPIEEPLSSSPLLSQRAILGDEVVAYETATFLSDGTYEVTDLYRGQLGTAVAAHPTGDRFVALDDGAGLWVQIDGGEWGVDHLVKVVPYGATVDEVVAVTHPVGLEPDHDETDLFNIDGLTATDYRDGILLQWSAIESPDLIYYEVRRGSRWNGAPVVARSADHWLKVTDASAGARTYLVRARFSGLLYSPECASVAITPAGPDSTASTATLTDLVSSAAGTVSDCAYDGTNNWLDIDDDVYTATYTTAELDAGSVDDYRWTVEVDSYEVDERAVSEYGDDVESLEQQVWTGDGRPPSKRYPGGDHEFVADGIDYPAYVDADRYGYGVHGNYGTHTRCKVDVRFDTDGMGSWTQYAPYAAQVRTAQKMQVRLTLDRWTHYIQRRVVRISAEARV